MCISPGGSSARNGSEVAYAYHQPSLPSTIDGSAKVSANDALTGLLIFGAAPAGWATAIKPLDITSPAVGVASNAAGLAFDATARHSLDHVTLDKVYKI